MRSVLVAGAQTALVLALAQAHRAAGAHVLLSVPGEGAGHAVDEVWHVPLGPQCADPVRARRVDEQDARALGEAARRLGARRLVLVLPETGHRSYLKLADRADALRRLAGMEGHTAVVCPPAPAGPLGPETLTAGVAHLIDSVRWVHAYVTARQATYFCAQPLRLIGQPTARLRLTWADDLAQELTTGAVGRVPARSIRLDQLLTVVTKAVGLPIRLVGSQAELTSVDRLLASRLGAYGQALREQPTSDVDAEATSRDERRIIGQWGGRYDTSILTSVGERRESTAIVLVNALGQQAGYWSRLISRLQPRYRVVLLSPRQSWPSGKAATFDDHLAELDEVVRTVSDEPVHLVGWCTGAKTVLAYHRYRPDMTVSATLLSPSFRHPGRPLEMDSAYERDLEATARLLTARPEQAARVQNVINGKLFPGTPASPQDAMTQADAVLSAAHPALDAELRAPFESSRSLLTYTSQLLDYWSRDVLVDAERIRFPVQVIGATHDTTLTTSGIRDAAVRIPGATYTEIEGASHYTMYDRPEIISSLIDEMISVRP